MSVFPIKHEDIPLLCWFTRGYFQFSYPETDPQPFQVRLWTHINGHGGTDAKMLMKIQQQVAIFYKGDGNFAIRLVPSIIL